MEKKDKKENPVAVKIEKRRTDEQLYLMLTETGVQVWVKRVSPLAVAKIEYCRTEFSSSSCLTRIFASALLAATSRSTGGEGGAAELVLFQWTIVAGTRTTVPLCFSSSDNFSDDCFRPRNGSNSSRKKALISIIKLLNARSENNALIRPLAPEVKIRDGGGAETAAVVSSIAISTCRFLMLLLLRRSNADDEDDAGDDELNFNCASPPIPNRSSLALFTVLVSKQGTIPESNNILALAVPTQLINSRPLHNSRSLSLFFQIWLPKLE